MKLKRVVVTGLGAVTPLGNNVKDTWDALINGVSGAGPITHFDASLFKTQFACEVKNFDASKYFDRKELTHRLEHEFEALCDRQFDDIRHGRVEEYEYLYKQKLKWYKKLEKRLKKIDMPPGSGV